MKRPFEVKVFYNGYMLKIGICVKQYGFEGYGFEDVYTLDYVKINRKDNKTLISDIKNIIGDIGIKCDIPKRFDVNLSTLYIVWEFEQ